MKLPFGMKAFRIFVTGGLVSLVVLGFVTYLFFYTSTSSFCMSCHEMQVVGEQGWMESKHYQNEHGVVAECADCHIPPDPLGMVWTKTRDGLWDLYVHLFGESNPELMDWLHLEKEARSKVEDASCMRCHQNLTPKGAPIKQIFAHMAYTKKLTTKRCVDCHDEQFHGGFMDYLYGPGGAQAKGGNQ